MKTTVENPKKKLFSVFDTPAKKKRKTSKGGQGADGEEKAEEKKEKRENMSCPLCDRIFSDPSFLSLHVSSHLPRQGSPSAKNTRKLGSSEHEDTKENIFSKMMASSASLPAAANRIVFSLNREHGKLLPKISLNDNDDGQEDAAWKSGDVNLRKVKGFSKNNDFSHFNDFTKVSNTLVLTCNIPPRNSTGDSPNKRKRVVSSTALISLYKSMIQKGFRRGLADKCLTLSTQLLHDHPEEWLRRVTIIILEDGCLHAGFPILAWMMVAVSKGYDPPDVLLAVCLQIVVEAAMCPWRDHAFEPSHDSLLEGHSISLRQLSDTPEVLTLVTSLLLRLSYGGMMGDMKMLWNYAIIWSRRLIYEYKNVDSDSQMVKNFPYLHHSYIHTFMQCLWGQRLLSATSARLKSSNFQEDSILLQYIEGQLSQAVSYSAYFSKLGHSDSNVETLVPEGLDFHCDPNMIPKIIDKLKSNEQFQKICFSSPNFDWSRVGDEVKMAIWQFRSSINRRSVWVDFFTEDEKLKYSEMLASTLKTKSQLANLWKVICPTVKDYCESKMVQIAKSRQNSEMD